MHYFKLAIIFLAIITSGACSKLNETKTQGNNTQTSEGKSVQTSQGNNSTQKLNSKIDESKRLGLHVGAATAYGSNTGGGSSYTSVTGIGAQAGIMSQDGSYNPIYNQATQGGGTYQSGYNPPDSYGVATSQLSPGYVGGSVGGYVNNANEDNLRTTFEVNSGSWTKLPNSNDYLWHGLNLHPSNSTHTNNTKSANHTKSPISL